MCWNRVAGHEQLWGTSADVHKDYKSLVMIHWAAKTKVSNPLIPNYPMCCKFSVILMTACLWKKYIILMHNNYFIVYKLFWNRWCTQNAYILNMQFWHVEILRNIHALVGGSHFLLPYWSLFNIPYQFNLCNKPVYKFSFLVNFQLFIYITWNSEFVNSKFNFQVPTTLLFILCLNN